MCTGSCDLNMYPKFHMDLPLKNHTETPFWKHQCGDYILWLCVDVVPCFPVYCGECRHGGRSIDFIMICWCVMYSMEAVKCLSYVWLQCCRQGRARFGTSLTHWPLGIIFKLIIQNSSLGAHCGIAVRWMPQNLTNEKSTLVQVMAWCR